jgi:hypothetical protein
LNAVPAVVAIAVHAVNDGPMRKMLDDRKLCRM